jgi:site-specific DNA-methyltransferase (adenine-specific)
VWFEGEGVTVYHGDCVEVMRELADGSVHAVVTDPPYGLEFMGREWDRFAPLEFEQWCELWARECLRILKPGGHLLAFGGSRTWHRLAAGIEDAGFEIRDSIAWLYGSGFPKSRNLDGDWEGWGTALKPAFEPVVVARKPLAGTVAANVLAHGTGALNIDGTRVPMSAADRVAIENMGGFGRAGSIFDARKADVSFMQGTDFRTGAVAHNAGRWPTNVVLEQSQAVELDAQTESMRAGKPSSGNTGGRGTPGSIYGPMPVTKALSIEGRFSDSGGASRFFPTFRYEAKAPTSERPRDGQTAHPTVKPLDLMRWLVRLVTPPGGTVLEPFAGSGTTLEAALAEGFTVIGIEREADYLPLIKQRISKPIQQSLFADLDGAA